MVINTHSLSPAGVIAAAAQGTLLLSIFALSACASGNARQATQTALELQTLGPGTEIAEAAAGDGIAAPADWWRSYGDPQLEQLITLALHQAPSMALVAARWEQAEAQLNSDESKLQPALQLDGAASADRFPGHDRYPSPYAGRAGTQGHLLADLQYRLDFWGRWRLQAEASSLRLQAQRAEIADAQLLLQTALADRYLQLATTWQLADLADEALHHRQQLLALLEARQRAGLGSKAEILQARVAQTQTRAEQAALASDIGALKHQLAALVGQPMTYADLLQRPVPMTAGDPVPLSAVPAHLLGLRPDVAACRSRLDAAAKDVGAARAAFYPDIDLRGYAGLQSLGLPQLLRADSLAAGIGPALSLPIFDGGARRAQLAGRLADYDAAVAAYNAGLVNALQQVADGIARLKAAQAREAEARSAVADQQGLLKLQQLRAQRGLADARDGIEAELNLLQTRRRALHAQATRNSAQLSLIRALGGAYALHQSKADTAASNRAPA